MHPRTVRAVTALSAAFWLLPFFGLIDLSVIVEQGPGWRPVYLLELGWGVLSVVLVGAPLAVAAVLGVSGVLSAQLLAVALAVAAAARVVAWLAGVRWTRVPWRLGRGRRDGDRFPALLAAGARAGPGARPAAVTWTVVLAAVAELRARVRARPAV